MPRWWRALLVAVLVAWVAALATGAGGAWAHLLLLAALAVFVVAPLRRRPPR
jgi:hypothetical protein